MSNLTGGPILIPIASGKGGVGKTILAANLGLALASRALTVVMVDMDLGGSNLHTLVGVRNTSPGVGGYLQRRVSRLDQLLLETRYNGLFLITGDGLTTGSANMPWWFKRKLLHEISGLDFDIVIIDLGAGSSFNTLDFFLSSSTGLLVTNPEPTSLLNTYGFLKNAYIRSIIRSFGRNTPQRLFLVEWVSQMQSGNGDAGMSLDSLMDERWPGSGAVIAKARSGLSRRIVHNNVRNDDEDLCWRRLASVADRNLGIHLEHLASLPHDPIVRQSIVRRIPAYHLDSASPFCMALETVASCLLVD